MSIPLKSLLRRAQKQMQKKPHKVLLQRLKEIILNSPLRKKLQAALKTVLLLQPPLPHHHLLAKLKTAR